MEVEPKFDEAEPIGFLWLPGFSFWWAIDRKVVIWSFPISSEPIWNDLLINRTQNIRMLKKRLLFEIKTEWSTVRRVIDGAVRVNRQRSMTQSKSPNLKDFNSYRIQFTAASATSCFRTLTTTQPIASVGRKVSSFCGWTWTFFCHLRPQCSYHHCLRFLEEMGLNCLTSAFHQHRSRLVQGYWRRCFEKCCG